ncbi:MAG: bifunctional 5,10-methylenetetrahydrofolate dehydrogenase/5,10-methenyltetrahydrofolate cyclohydrolase [bacterium]
MAKIIDGRAIADKLLQKLKEDIEIRGLKLAVAVVQVGGNAVSDVYLKEKEKACEKAGIKFVLLKFPETVSNDVLADEIKSLDRRPDINGIVVQLPLPKTIDSQRILNCVSLKKDIDCLSEAAVGRVYARTSTIMPPVVGAISKILQECEARLKEKNVVIVGAGRLVGKPAVLWFLNQGATVSVVNESTRDISFFTKNADILISGVGKAKLINGNIVKEKAIVIDAGSSVENGKTLGDVDFESVIKKAGWITPVPGGVGPLAVACLLENILKLNSGL